MLLEDMRGWSILPCGLELHHDLSLFLCGNKQLHGKPAPTLFDLLFSHLFQKPLSSDVPP